METLEQTIEKFKDFKYEIQKIVNECHCDAEKIKKRINNETEFYCEYFFDDDEFDDDKEVLTFVLLHMHASRAKKECFFAKQNLHLNFDTLFTCDNFDNFDEYLFSSLEIYHNNFIAELDNE